MIENFNRIFQTQYKEIIKNTAYKFKLNHEDVQEKLHEVYISIAQALSNKKDNSNLKTDAQILNYIYSCIKNKIKKTKKPVLMKSIDEDFDSIEEIQEPENEDIKKFYYEIFEYLELKANENIISDIHLSVFKFHLYYYNLSYQQIANRTKLTKPFVQYSITTIKELLQTDPYIFKKLKEYNLLDYQNND